MDFINKIFRGDRVIWMIFMFLCLISIVVVYSASSTLTFRTDYWGPIFRHTVILLFGVFLVLFIHSIKPRYLSLIGILLPAFWLLMIATWFIGESVNGAYRWISIGGQSFQPSELAKMSLMVLTAFLLSRINNTNEKATFWKILVFAGGTCVIILIDNLSTALMLFLIVYVMMFLGGIARKRIFLLGLSGLAFGALFFAFICFTPHTTLSKIFPRGITWQERIMDHRTDLPVSDPAFKINDDNRQSAHASIAIAEGRIFGKMPGNSQQRDFLPQAYSDFIFAIVIEEMGVIGGFFVLMLYLILFIRAGIIANRCDRLFAKYIVMGAALILVSQAMTNMAVAVGLLPVTGQPLPLISRGGTSTLINCFYIGVILSVSRFENPRGKKREEQIKEELMLAEQIEEENPFVAIEEAFQKEEFQ